MTEITDVVVERVGSRIHLYSAPPWEVPGLKEMIKRVPGANWKKTDTCWTYPLSMDSCRALRRVFDDMLVVGPDLAAWAREAMTAEEARVRLAHMKNVKLTEVPQWYPEVFSKMRNYQRVGAKYLAQSPSILADQPGLGKTLQMLMSLVEGDRLEGIHLIAAPVTSLEVVWVNQIAKWLGLEAMHVTGSADKRRATIQEFFDRVDEYPPTDGYAHFLVINPEMLSIKEVQRVDDDGHKVWNDNGEPVMDEVRRFPELFEPRWTSFTVDEAQDYILGIKNAKRMTQTGRGLMAVQTGHKVALTGTPMRGRPVKLWSLLHWLHPDLYRSYWQWVETYFTVSDNGYGKEISEEPAIPEVFYRSLDTVMLRRTKGEVLKDLPPKMYNDIWVEMVPAQAKQYEDMIKNSEAKFGEVQVSSTGILAELTRLSQIATSEMVMDDPRGKPRPSGESGKFIRLYEELHERGVVGDDQWGENKYVVASQSTEVLHFLETWFTAQKVPTLRIDGGVSQGQRSQAQKLFQTAGGARIMLIQTTTAKAIDLDALCDEMFVLDETFVPDDQEQLEDRIHRASRIHQVTIHYIRTKGTIDETRKELVDGKENIQKLILDGRRGVEFAKRLIGRT
jgi:SNF2 family DNA or RNA helicase